MTAPDVRAAAELPYWSKHRKLALAFSTAALAALVVGVLLGPGLVAGTFLYGALMLQHQGGIHAGILRAQRQAARPRRP